MENAYFEARPYHSQVERYFPLHIVYVPDLFTKNLLWCRN